MSDDELIELAAAALYAARRPSYVPVWSAVDPGHAMKQGALNDARIALKVFREQQGTPDRQKEST